MQIQTMTQHCYTLARMAKIQILGLARADKDTRQMRLSYTADGFANNVTTPEGALAVFYKANISLSSFIPGY